MRPAEPRKPTVRVSLPASKNGEAERPPTPSHPKKIFYPDGETIISDRKIRELLELEKALIRCRLTEVIESGYFLSEIRKKKSFFYFLETGIHPFKGGNYIAEQTEEIGFIQYCRDRLKMSKTDVYRRIRIHEHLYLNFPHVFERWIDSDGVLPDIKRLDFLSLKDRWQHPEEICSCSKKLPQNDEERELAESLFWILRKGNQIGIDAVKAAIRAALEIPQGKE